ncbi:hypothetical protein PMAYCL1PPCAC_17076, partial [Pristionchus mayeri]
SYSSILADFHAGRRRLVLNEKDNYFNSEDIPIILGSNESIHWSSSASDSLAAVCGDLSLVGLFYETDIFAFTASSLAQSCYLSRVRLLPGESTGAVWLTHSIHEGDAYYFPISRMNPRVVMEKINWALLTVFTQD